MTVSLVGEESSRQLVLPEALFATDVTAWLTEASLPASPLQRREIDGRSLPVLYGAHPMPAAVISEDGEAVHVAVDVFGSAFFMLTRYEEMVVGERDALRALPGLRVRRRRARASSGCRSSTPTSSCCGARCDVSGHGSSAGRGATGWR